MTPQDIWNQLRDYDDETNAYIVGRIAERSKLANAYHEAVLAEEKQKEPNANPDEARTNG